jgi:hypothetical protein
MRTAAAVWTISPELVLAIDEHLGAPVDSYVNGSQTWLVGDEDAGETVLEFRLHPVAGYRTPKGASHYDVWEQAVSQLAQASDAAALHLGDEIRPLSSCWDGLECFAPYADDLEPARLASQATEMLGRTPDRAGLVDHDAIGDAWERAHGNVSIVALLMEQLTT